MSKFLIIRFSSIGDIVLTSPILRCIKKQNEFHEIHFVTKKQFSGVISANPNISKIYTFEKSIEEIINQLILEHYDYVIDLHKNIRSTSLKLKLKRPSFSYHKLNFKKWLAVNMKLNILPTVHIIDRYFYAIEKLNIKNDHKGLDFFISPENEVDIKNLPFFLHKECIGFVIGAAHFTKKFPKEKIVELISNTSENYILLGGKDDFEDGNFIVENSKNRNVFNACGKYNLQQSASLINQCKLIISNDTGLMHIAAACKKKIISIWGNTIPKFGMYPYFPGEGSVMIENHGLTCRPCSKIGFQKCPKGHFKCMNEIKLSEIIKHI